MTEEIKANEETMIEAAEEVVQNVDLTKGLKIAGIGAAAIAGGYFAYKYAVKPIIAKLKSKSDERDGYFNTTIISEPLSDDESIIND